MKKLDLTKYKFYRDPDKDFVSDGTQYTCYGLLEADRIVLAKANLKGKLFLVISIDGKLDFDSYSHLPHYECLSRLNGLKISKINDLAFDQLRDDCIAYQKEYEELEKNTIILNNNEEETTKESDNSIKLDIKYKRPAFHRRVLANLVDFLLCLLLFFTVFISARAIVDNNAYYSNVYNQLERMQIASGIYVHTPDGKSKIISVIDHIDYQKDKTPQEKVFQVEHYIDVFMNYCEKVCKPEDYALLAKRYDDYRLIVTYNDTNTHYFIKDGEKIIKNPDIPNKVDGKTYYDLFYENVYTPFVLNDCEAFMVSAVPHYREYQVAISNIIFFVEIPVSLVLSTFITYLIVPLCFRRTRQTLGKALYHISLVDQQCLSVKTGRIIARQLIVIIVELYLSLATLCVPIIVSFSMMAFSKKKQSFCDFMCGTQEIDTTTEKIYHSKEEIYLEMERKKGGAVDFKMAKTDE